MWILACFKRARLAHWVMDLYPDIAVALGEISAGGRLARWVDKLMGVAWRGADLVVALDEDMAERLKGRREAVRCLTPWPPALAEDGGSGDAGAVDPPEVLYSGNLGRAHDVATLMDAMELFRKRGGRARLVFQGGGALRSLAEERAAAGGAEAVQFRDYASWEELPRTLLRARVLVVTQAPVTRGMLWPSKLALLEQTGCHLLFVGPPDGAIAARLRSAGHGVFAPGEAEEVAAWLEKKMDEPSGVPADELRKRVAAARGAGLARMEEMLSCLPDGENHGQ
jgi:glycosyltransferase involved in cell wall biosynthesis